MMVELARGRDERWNALTHGFLNTFAPSLLPSPLRPEGMYNLKRAEGTRLSQFRGLGPF